MRFVDRKATKPNRYKATPEEGNSFYVVLERADEPTEEGTPLNAAMLNIMASLSSLSPAMMDDGSNGTGGDNSVEDGEYEPIADPTTGLPVVTEDDNGKILKVVGGAWAVTEDGGADEELPGVTADDNGKVLKVVDGAWVAAEEEAAEDELPAVTTEDNGKFLRVADGVWAAVTVTAAETVSF